MATFNDNFPIMTGRLVHTKPLFHKLKLLTIYDIFKLQLGNLVYESTNDIGQTNKIIKFNKVSEIHNYNTRYANNNNFFINNARTTRFGLKSLLNEGTNLWASLSNELKNCKTRNSFKNNLKISLIESYLN